MNMMRVFVKYVLLSGFLVALWASFTGSQDDTGFFWHVSDFHSDKDYTTYGLREASCHHTPNQTVSDDIGPYGDFLCDAPRVLVESAVTAMQKIKPDPDFILWTGDNLPHVPGLTFSDLCEETRWLVRLLRSSFPTSTLVPTLGNHDCSPANAMSPPFSSFLARAGLDQLLPGSLGDTFGRGGYYNMSLRGSLRLVCLNSVLWYTGNKVFNATDSDRQLEWLRFQLQEANRNGEKVYLSGHVAPGFNNHAYGENAQQLLHDSVNERYHDIIAEFNNTVAGQFFGHQHGNTFVLLSDGAGQFVGSAHLAGSVTPWSRDTSPLSYPNNPNVRLYKYDRSTARLLDYTVYYLDLDKANAQPQVAPTWEQLYTLSSSYGVADATTSSMAELAERLWNSPELEALYRKYITALKEERPCNATCRRVELCAAWASRSKAHQKCMLLGAQGLASSQPRTVVEATTSIRDLLTGFSVSGLILVSIVLVVRAKRARMMVGPRYGRFS